MGEGVTTVEIGGRELDDGPMVFTDALLEFVQCTEHVLGGSVIGEQQPEKNLDLDAWWKRTRPCPRVRVGAAT